MEFVLYYQDIYLALLAIICMAFFGRLKGCNANTIINTPLADKNGVILIFCIIVLFIGLRPVHWFFVDTLNYAASYEAGQLDDHNDPGIWWIAKVCHIFNMPVNVWFLIIAFIYFFTNLLSAKHLSRNNWEYIYLTFLVAFSTYAYATNGIRNGMGLGMLMLGITYYLGDKNLRAAIPLFLFAIFTHKSTILPLACFFVAYYFVDLKRAIFFWGLAVIISALAGNIAVDFFTALGFDDRVDKYLNAEEVEGVFSHLGFRWDFLLYSVMPIWLGYYIVKVRGIHDKIYDTLLGTYVLSNAFWVMVIRAQYSDRFAYLSWFLYPFVIAYPLFKMNIWGNKQGLYAKSILIAHLAFTLFMHFIYYGFIKYGIIMA